MDGLEHMRVANRLKAAIRRKERIVAVGAGTSAEQAQDRRDLKDLREKLAHHLSQPVRTASDALEAENVRLRDALRRLTLEAIHYRQTGVGAQFLDKAIEQANTALA